MKTKDSSGYIYLDVLVALLIFGIGMLACLQINNNFVLLKAENANYLKAIQIASSKMDEMVEVYKENSPSASLLINKELRDEENESFERIISFEKDHENSLLKVKVRIKWMERGEPREYTLETEIAAEGEL